MSFTIRPFQRFPIQCFVTSKDGAFLKLALAYCLGFATLITLLLLSSRPTYAACTCQCVNGTVVPLCSSALDMPPICSLTICPITPPSIAPINPLRIPPIGTSNCTMKQVFNNYTGQYEWRQICE